LQAPLAHEHVVVLLPHVHVLVLLSLLLVVVWLLQLLQVQALGAQEQEFVVDLHVQAIVEFSLI